jgi:hypothetical protein
MEFYGGGSDSEDVSLYALHNFAEAGNADGIAALIKSLTIISPDPLVHYSAPPLFPLPYRGGVAAERTQHLHATSPTLIFADTAALAAGPGREG